VAVLNQKYQAEDDGCADPMELMELLKADPGIGEFCRAMEEKRPRDEYDGGE
jgi:hypothetical protein